MNWQDFLLPWGSARHKWNSMSSMGNVGERCEESFLSMVMGMNEFSAMREMRKWARDGGDLDIRVASGKTLLAEALAHGKKRLANWMFTYGAEPGRIGESFGAIGEAAILGDWIWVEKLLSVGGVVGTNVELTRILASKSDDCEASDTVMILSDAIPEEALLSTEIAREGEKCWTSPFFLCLERGWDDTSRLLVSMMSEENRQREMGIAGMLVGQTNLGEAAFRSIERFLLMGVGEGMAQSKVARL